MRPRIVMDLSPLPAHCSGSSSPTWWGTASYMLIEGAGFALALAVYLYLMSLAPSWPINAPLPDLWPGTLSTAVFIASLVPNVLLSRWAQRRDLQKVRVGLIVMSVFGIVPLLVRPFEFAAMHVRWDDNAYGSVTWFILGLHTTHVLTDLIDTVVLAALMFTRHADSIRRYGDTQDNAMYWTFVVLTWLPIYGVLYWVPRL